MFLLFGLLLLVFLPSPWSVVAFGGCLILGVAELLFWRRRVRGLPARAGAATLIGQQAKVISACRPLGQVAVSGELWAARCPDGADADETVRVVGRERLVLLVETAGEEASAASQ
jgi:membrane protein implicated in regulation of membrane protease activity